MKKPVYFGEYGGRYVPEMLQGTLADLAEAYDKLKNTPSFKRQLKDLQTKYNNRPTPLVEVPRFSKAIGSKARILIKNEGLNHTGAHKINHCLGQALVAKHLGKTRLIAETGAGQHGVATATVAARFGMKCTVYMGEVDIDRQRPNAMLMQLLGAEVVAVKDGSRTLTDAVNAAIRDFMKTSDNSHYVLGSCLGPDPYPRMNRDFQSVISREIRSQLGDVMPSAVFACVGGGSNATGAFYGFIKDKSVELIGVEAGGVGKKLGQNAIRFPNARRGVFEGYKSYFLQGKDGNSSKTQSIAAGLDYIGISPELAYLHDTGRIKFVSASDKEALEAVKILAQTEGMIPAMESAHAIAHVIKTGKNYSQKDTLVINMSGRGDKDIFILGQKYGGKDFAEFLKKQAKILEGQL